MISQDKIFTVASRVFEINRHSDLPKPRKYSVVLNPPISAPELKIDTILYDVLSSSQRRERRIVANLCAHLYSAGFALVGLHDGKATHAIDGKTLSLEDATIELMELAFSLTDCRVWFRKGKLDGLNGLAKSIHLVFGSANDCFGVIADYSLPNPDPDGWNNAIESFDVKRFE